MKKKMKKKKNKQTFRVAITVTVQDLESSVVVDRVNPCVEFLAAHLVPHALDLESFLELTLSSCVLQRLSKTYTQFSFLDFFTAPFTLSTVASFFFFFFFFFLLSHPCCFSINMWQSMVVDQGTMKVLREDIIRIQIHTAPSIMALCLEGGEGGKQCRKLQITGENKRLSVAF